MGKRLHRVRHQVSVNKELYRRRIAVALLSVTVGLILDTVRRTPSAELVEHAYSVWSFVFGYQAA